MSSGNKFVRVVGKGHSKCMIEHIRECWDKECYSNVRFVCKQQAETVGKIISANKAVLAASSPKLGLMLSDTGEEEDVTIIIPESDFSIVKMLLQYIYSGEVIVDALTNELEALIKDWDITFPEVVPVLASKEPQESSLSEVVIDLNLSTSPDRILLATHQHSKGEGQLPSEQSPLYKQLSENINLPADIAESASVMRSKSTAQRIRTSTSNRSVDESSGNYVFLAAYLKKSNFKDRVGETLPVAPTKKNANKKNPPNVNSSVNDADVHSNGKETPRKRPRVQTSQNSAILGDGSCSIDASPGIDDSFPDESIKDSEEDKADEILSKAFFEEEKARQKLMNELAEDLKGSIARHKSYVKHFIGPDVLLSKPQTRSQNKQDVPRIPCVTCGKLVNRDYMKEHAFIHTKERPFLCEQCGSTFSLADRLRKHVKFAHPDESEIQSFACTVCNKVFKKTSYLQRHMTLHSGQRPYSCPYCDKSFRLPNVLMKHKRTHTGERPYECETCHKKFSARSNYVTHLRTHSKRAHVLTEAGSGTASAVDPETQLLKCNICGTSFHREYAFLIHVAAHKGEDPKLPCRHCSETFASHRLLKEHAREQHADALFQCDQCPSMFINKTTLNAHMLIHSEGKKHPCDDCNKEFQTKVQLEIHRKSVHSEERPFTCRFCSKGFKSKLVLRQHERIHTGERPYKCPHCSKCFRQDVHLANHIRIHTGEKPFACGYCNKAFSHQNNLRIHEKIHTGDKNQCATCGQVFRSVVKLRQHENTHVFQEEGLEADVLNEGMREETRDHLQESEED